MSTSHEIVDELRQEFMDEAHETLQALDVAVDNGRHGRGDHREIVAMLRRAAFLLRGQAANFGMRGFSVLCHRLDEYLAGAPPALPPRTWDDLQRFIDVLLGLLNNGGGGEADPSELVRTLPPKLGFELGDIEIRNVEVMLVMPHGAQTRYVERELQQCGFRVSIISDTILAFAMVTQTKPDLIVVSAIMPGLDGIDLAIALTAMPSTRNIPIAVITSLDPDDERLTLLPRRIPLLHKGSTFGDDLFKALDSLFLI